MNFKNILSILLVLMTINSLSGQNDTETRSYTKRFHVGKETLLEVNNKYGSIHVTTWKKDSAYVQAEIKAIASNQTKLNTMFEGIRINFTEAANIVRAQTDFTQNINMLFENFKGMTNKIIQYDSRVEINYYINIPDYLNLTIENKYGDVYMERNSGDLSISVSNGSFMADSLGKGSTLKLSFCDATIAYVASGKLDASFSEISINETKELSFNSTSCRYKIKKAGILKLESRRDNFDIDHMESLFGNSYFTDYEIGTLRNEINFTTRYGNLNIDNIEKSFRSININSGYTDITLGFDPNATYDFDLRTTNSSLLLPFKNAKTDKKTLNEDKKEYITVGTVGQNPGNPKIKIEANRGKIYFK
jgi:hypothetical protein